MYRGAGLNFVIMQLACPFVRCPINWSWEPTPSQSRLHAAHTSASGLEAISFRIQFFWDALAGWWCHAGTAEELLAPAPPAFLGKLFKVSMSLDASCMLKSLAVHFGFVFIALYFETRYCVSALIVLVSRSASLPSIYDSWLRVAGVFICRCFFWASRNDLSKCERLVPKFLESKKVMHTLPRFR